jgi:hypothetical protein
MTTIQIDLQEKHLETILNILSNLKDELLDFYEAVREIRSGKIS